MKILYTIFGLFISIGGAVEDHIRPNKRRVKKYLKRFFAEPYQMEKEFHEKGDRFNAGYDIYELYLPERKINTTVTVTKENADAIHKFWSIQGKTYFEDVFRSLSAERENLRKEKYPGIKEEIEYRNTKVQNPVPGREIDSVNIFIDSKDDYESLYNYLIECYRLNDFRYYNTYLTVYGKLKQLCWEDFVSLRIFCGSNVAGAFYFSELREKKYCMPDELNQVISYESFVAKLR